MGVQACRTAKRTRTWQHGRTQAFSRWVAKVYAPLKFVSTKNTRIGGGGSRRFRPEIGGSGVAGVASNTGGGVCLTIRADQIRGSAGSEMSGVVRDRLQLSSRT